MQIGDLDRRIRIEVPTKTANSYGEETLSWGAYRNVWAKMEWKGGSEKEETQRITATSKLVFTIRNLDISINEQNRINYDGKSYYIKVINEIEGRESFLELETEQKD
jgi:SPP1 family predicted phage head-tail adaptor